MDSVESYVFDADAEYVGAVGWTLRVMSFTAEASPSLTTTAFILTLPERPSRDIPSLYTVPVVAVGSVPSVV